MQAACDLNLDRADNVSSNKLDSSETIITLPIQASTAYPTWLLKLYENENSRIIHYVILYDSVGYAILQENVDGVCLKTSLVSFKHQTEQERAVVASECDNDLSLSEYQWTEYAKKNDSVFISTHYRTYIPDSLLDKEGKMSEGSTIEDYPTLIDSSQSFIMINSLGHIERSEIRINEE